MNLGIWNMYGALYGTPESTEYIWNMIRPALLSVPGAKAYLQGDRPTDDAGWNYREKLMRGEPNMTEFGIVNWRGGGHINLSPMGPVGGEKALLSHNLVKGIYAKHGLDYITEFFAAPRLQGQLLMVMFDPKDEEETARADACSRELILETAKIGMGELKANLEYMDLVRNTYNNNNDGLGKLYQKLKDTLDPPGILSPGKSGIWPSDWKHSRL